MKKIVLIAVLAMVAAPVYANDQSSGCGLGWEVFKKNSLISSWLRSSTNMIASNSIAMTVGTSGCAKHDIVQKEHEAEYFAEANYQKLESEMAEGKGEHIVAFAKIMGCSDAQAAKAGALLQNNYERVFSSDKVPPGTMLKQTADVIYGSDLGCKLGA